MQKSIEEPQVIHFDIVITSYSLQLEWSYDHNTKLHGSGNGSKGSKSNAVRNWMMLCKFYDTDLAARLVLECFDIETTLS